MCGIAGYCQRDDKRSMSELKNMTEALRRRGPDDSGHFSDKSVGLGMRRLSIIDLEHGQQPVWSYSERYIAVFNGEIYNYKSLRQELIETGFSFRSKGDAEVVVNLYEHQGLQALNRLRGMFAVAIWDTQDKELILVRDQLGIKPLYYNLNKNSLLFGSEIKALLKVMPERLDVDAQAIDALFAYTYIPAPLSIWKDIRKLRPGYFLRWRDGKAEEHRYWDLMDALKGEEPSIEDLGNNIDDTISAHLVSDVEVGAFLSGGLDSSTVVSRMQRQVKIPIQALSVKFENKGHLFDETRYAEELSSICGFNLDVHTVASSDYSCIMEAIQAIDEPFGDDSIVPNMAISELAAKKLKVVLSGAGGDEVFGGYNRYQGVALHSIMAKLPYVLRKFVLGPLLNLSGRLVGSGSRQGDLIQRFASDLHSSPDDAYMGYITSASPGLRRKLLDTKILEKVDMDFTFSLIREHQLRASSLSPVKRAMYVDFNTYLPEDVLALSDRIGMWHSLEIRTPLADRNLAEVAFRLPACELATSRSKKVALRKAVKSWLPKSILSHPKQGFEGPTASWLRDEGAETFRQACKADIESGNGLINHPAFEELLQEHVSGKADHAKRLFTALTVMYWKSLYLSRVGGIA